MFRKLKTFTFCGILSMICFRPLIQSFIGFLIVACLFPIHRLRMVRLQLQILTLSHTFHQNCTKSLKKCLSKAVRAKSVKRSGFNLLFYFVSWSLEDGHDNLTWLKCCKCFCFGMAWELKYGSWKILIGSPAFFG